MKGKNVYFYVYKTQILKSLTYKFNVYGNILMQTIIMIANAFFWKALYRGKDMVLGVTVDTMMTYTVISSAISVVLITNVERRLQNSVRTGTIAVDMVRPVNIFKVFFAEDLGNLTALVFQNLIPILIVGAVLIGVPKPASPISLLLFGVSLFLAYCINYLLAVLFGMLAFSIIEMDALFQVKKHLIRLLSGSIIPIWFMPQWFAAVLKCLPFVYLYQMPLDMYIGKYTPQSLVWGLGVQCVWVIGLYFVYQIRQKSVIKQLMVQGG